MPNRRDKNSADLRPKTIASVWGTALAMLALCIPLTAVTRSAIIPVLVIVGAAIVTFYIWNSGGNEASAEESENEALKAKIKELEERLANVEVINRFEDRLAEKRLRLAEEQQEADRATAPSRKQDRT